MYVNPHCCLASPSRAVCVLCAVRRRREVDIEYGYGIDKLKWQVVFRAGAIDDICHPDSAPRAAQGRSDGGSSRGHCEEQQNANFYRYASSPIDSPSVPQCRGGVSPRGRRKRVELTDAAEAQASLTLLTQLCPFFLQLKLIGRSEWLEMPPQVAAAVPSSPGQSMLGSAASILPRHSHLPIPPRSPRTVSGSSTGVAAQGGQGGVPRTPTTPRTPGRAGLRALQDELEADDPDAEASAKGSMTLTPGRGAGTYAHVSDTHHLALSPLRARTTPRSSMPSPSPGRAARIAAMELGGVSPASAHAMAALGDDAGLESVLGAGGLGLGGVGAGIGAGAMAGPASPGRVRRVGGLREVRERIRRELGE